MEREPSQVDPQSFFRVASWQCVRSSNATAVARALELLHYQPASVPQDLGEVDPHELPCLVVTIDGWTYVFGHALGLKGTRQLSAEFGECVALHVDESSGTFRCERAIDGEVVRRVYASARDHEYDSDGEPAAGEPPVERVDGPGEEPELSMTGADVLRFAQAWGSDPEAIFKKHVTRAFVASRKPIVTRPSTPRASILATLVGALFILTVLGLTGAAVWWLLEQDQEVAAAQFCEQQWNCSGCVGCTGSPPHPCAEKLDACEEDEACFALTQCLANCQDLVARAGFTAPGEAAIPCFAECREAHGAGLQPYCEWTECSYRQACSNLCTEPGYLALAACQ